MDQCFKISLSNDTPAEGARADGKDLVYFIEILQEKI